MTTHHILIEGYARQAGDETIASPATVLLEDSDKRILVDPGANPERLLETLAAHNIRRGSIDLVFVTHHHLDHLLNIRLFPETPICDGEGINRGDRITPISDSIPGTQIQVFSTPGHTPEHWSLLTDTDQGRVAIAGDVFWWYEHEEQAIDLGSLMAHADPYALDWEALRASRCKLLHSADWIIPGHGSPFRSPVRQGFPNMRRVTHEP